MSTWFHNTDLTGKVHASPVQEGAPAPRTAAAPLTPPLAAAAPPRGANVLAARASPSAVRESRPRRLQHHLAAVACTPARPSAHQGLLHTRRTARPCGPGPHHHLARSVRMAAAPPSGCGRQAQPSTAAAAAAARCCGRRRCLRVVRAALTAAAGAKGSALLLWAVAAAALSAVK